MRVTYDAALRKKAKEQGRKLFTLSAAGITAQGMSDDQLDQDLLRAFIEYRKRLNAAEKQPSAKEGQACSSSLE